MCANMKICAPLCSQPLSAQPFTGKAYSGICTTSPAARIRLAVSQQQTQPRVHHGRASNGLARTCTPCPATMS